LDYIRVECTSTKLEFCYPCSLLAVPLFLYFLALAGGGSFFSLAVVVLVRLCWSRFLALCDRKHSSLCDRKHAIALATSSRGIR
jgi:hypothetical protein